MNQKTLKILYLTQTFPPEPGPTIKPLRQAVLLQRLGHHVTILTTMPYYPHGKVQVGYRNRLILKEQIEGVNVLRVWSLPAPNRGFVRRLISYGTFSFNATLSGLFLSRYDLVIASVPNPLTECAALVIGRLKRSRVMLELRDIYSDSLIALGKSPVSLFFRVVEAYYQCILRLMDLIAVSGNFMIPRLAELGVPENRILKLLHATDSEYIDATDPREFEDTFKLKGMFISIYAGSFSPSYDIPNLVKAARILKQTRPSFRLVLLGTGTDSSRVEKMITAWNLDNVILVGAVIPRKVYSYLQAADLCLAPCGVRSRFFQDHLYTKSCEYLMAGKPVLAIEDQPVLGKILKEANAGRSVPFGNPEALAHEIEFFIDHPEQRVIYGKNARKYAWENLRREKIVMEFEVELKKKLASLTALNDSK